MPSVWQSNQVSGGSVQAGLAAFPAGSSLMRARLRVFTSFTSNFGSQVVGWAPPNTILGISWKPAGQTPDLVSPSNWGNAEWYIAGVGKLLAVDTYTYAVNAGPGPTILNQTYSQEIELATPAFQSLSYSVGISINWLGAGFWPSNEVFLSYQFEADYA